MSASLKYSTLNHEKAPTYEEQRKINEVRSAVSPLPEKLSGYCSDATITRYLRVQNWNVKKAVKMLKESFRWRLEYKPDEICWEDIVSEGESGKIYNSTSVDKKGRPLLVMRPCRQTSNSTEEQIKFLVYCMENAILNMPSDVEEMIWLVDFHEFSMSNVSFKAAKETAKILQNYYPGRLGIAIMYNPPWIFEQFYKMVKPFLESGTQDKVKFVYPGDTKTMKIMEDIFDMDQLETAFGGKAAEGFDAHSCAQRRREVDEKRRSLFHKGNDEFADKVDLNKEEKIDDKITSSNC